MKLKEIIADIRRELSFVKEELSDEDAKLYIEKRMMEHHDTVDFTIGQLQIGSNVPSGSYKDFNVTFPEAFGATPSVMVCLKSASTGSGMGKVSCSAINESKTGFTIRAFNGDSTGREPDYRWIAVAKD